MRSIKELLELMLQHKDLFDSGLCGWAASLCGKCIITESETGALLLYINHNPPDYFSWTNFVKNHKHKGYFFPCGKIKPRIYWIKRHIKKNS